MNTRDEAITSLKQQLIVDEGIRLKPYKDTVGKLTIGVGRNLDDKGISFNEAMDLLENDIQDCYHRLETELLWFKDLDYVRQIVLANMAFNMGIKGLFGFKLTLKLIELKNYKQAAKEMLNSKWSHQVGLRALKLSKMMETGKCL